MPESGDRDQIADPQDDQAASNTEDASTTEDAQTDKESADRKFIEEMESDPARAGADSPDQRLIGG